MGKINSRRF